MTSATQTAYSTETTGCTQLVSCITQIQYGPTFDGHFLTTELSVLITNCAALGQAVPLTVKVSCGHL
jgi:hypothetical protein